MEKIEIETKALITSGAYHTNMSEIGSPTASLK